MNLLDRLNARHPWSHNHHYHRWVLDHLPARRGAALDVGCGRGDLLAALAGRFDRVTGVDVDEEMVAAARERTGLDVRQESFLETTGRFDLVTMVAVLHHLPLEPALRHAAGLLDPGGRLLVVGLARSSSPLDLGYDGASSLFNPLVGLAKHPRAFRGGPQPPGVPVRDPEETFAEVRRTAERVLPGARVRRRLFFRYTLEWQA